MRYKTDEIPFQGRNFTERQFKKIYHVLADKTEYPDFKCWKADMIKSGVFEKVAR